MTIAGQIRSTVIAVNSLSTFVKDGGTEQYIIEAYAKNDRVITQAQSFDEFERSGVDYSKFKPLRAYKQRKMVNIKAFKTDESFFDDGSGIKELKASFKSEVYASFDEYMADMEVRARNENFHGELPFVTTSSKPKVLSQSL
ncbi:hypothetical protein M2H03_20370 [Vibrio vulnificus]|nr:hypothetical protein [Vibrio vulnificus]